MATPAPSPKVSFAGIGRRRQKMFHTFTRATRPIRTMTSAAIFFLKVFPMLPSQPVDWVTKPPLTALLEPDEAERFRSAFTNESGHLNDHSLSTDGQAVYSLLTALDEDDVETALHRLPPIMQERLNTLSPLNYLKDIHAPLIILLHDRGDQVIPVGESRRLRSALAAHAGVHYTEMRFQHLDPVKGKLPLFRLIWELGKFFLAVYPIFRQAVAS